MDGWDAERRDVLGFRGRGKEPPMLESYGIYKGYYDDLTDLEFGEMFSAGIARSVQQFKTDGSQMAGAIQTLGASATTSNVPLEEQLSILGMLQATMGGSEAGTKYKAFLQSAAKAGDALGLSFTDANNQLLSMPEILDALRGKFGDTMDAAEKLELQKAFGTAEAVSLIDLLYSKTDDLQENILDMYSALGSGTGVATEMANAMNEAEPERFERLTQRIQNVKESIGNSLLPTVNDLISVGENVLTKVGSWIEENQELVKIIMLIVLGIGGFLMVAGTAAAVVGGVGLAVTKAVSAFKMLKAGFGIVRAALSPLIGSVLSFTAALLANPVTWVVIGIVAIVAAIVLLYNKCEWFRNLVDNIVGSVKEKFGALKDSVVEKLDNMRAAYESHGGGIQGAAAAAIEGVKGIYEAGYTFLDNLTGGKLTAIKDKFLSGVTNIASGVRERFEAVKTAFSNGITNIKDTVTGAVTWFFESGKKVVSTFSDGIRSAFTGAVDAVKGGLQRIRNMLPFSDAKEGPLSTLTLSGQRTMTTYASGLEKASNAPVQAMERGLGAANNVLERTVLTPAIEPIAANAPQAESDRPKPTLEREPVKKISLSGDSDGKDNEGGGSSSGDGNTAKRIIIEKLILYADIKKLKDLQYIYEVAKEIEDLAIANGSEETADDPDAVPTMT